MSISGGAHLVSSNHLQGLPVKKTATPFFSRDLFPKSKCPLYFQPLARALLPLTCKASSSNNDRRIPRPRRKNFQAPPPTPREKFKNYSDQDDSMESSPMLSLQNGRSTTSDGPTQTKSVNPADIVELFKKHLPQLSETAKSNNRSYGLNATMLNRDKEDRESFKALLKLLKSSGANQKEPVNDIATKGANNNIGKVLKYEDAGNEDSDDDITDEDSDIEDDVPDEDSDIEDDVPDMPLTSSRPPSSFSRRPAFSEAKYEPVMPSKTQGETQMLGKEKDSGSKSLFYESESESEVEEEPMSDSVVYESEVEEPISDSVVYESENESVAEEKSGSEFIIYESESESVAEQSEGLYLEEKIEDLSALKLSELREIAKSRGLKGYSKLKKAELLEKLSPS